jgi:16S rRNA (cytidine1402-2'-O)-methyltransferase
MPALYVVATPIGNLEDITFRAIRTLKEVKLIAAEDTRKTRRLLSAYNISTPTTSYHEHNKLSKLDYILGRLDSDDVALVSDAGMPGISDPGYELISAAINRTIPVIPIPGPSVLVTALVLSGLPADSFYFLGFLPHKAGERRRMLASCLKVTQTLITFEAPHRINKSLQDMQDVLGNRRIVVCRELTKIHEEIFRGTIDEALRHFTAPRGEFTLVIEGNKEQASPIIDRNLEDRIRKMQKSGATAKAAVAQLVEETGLSRKELYLAWIKMK